jgi:hypothetical protein
MKYADDAYVRQAVFLADSHHVPWQGDSRKILEAFCYG